MAAALPMCISMAHPTDAPALLWFRNDLRLSDHPALSAAAATGRPVLPLYVFDEAAAGAWTPGGASRWWLHHSLAALAAELSAKGAPLVLRRGSTVAEILRLVLNWAWPRSTLAMRPSPGRADLSRRSPRR